MSSRPDHPRPPLATAASTQPQTSRMRKLAYTLARITRGVALVVVAGATVAVVQDVREKRRAEKEFRGDKKRVLVLPLHRMALVEKRKPSFGKALEDLSAGKDNEHDRTFEVEVKELVDIIHEAAQDPNIVALYGVFGHGFTSSVGGWAQVEEVRNALKVFRESHRMHREPNLKHEEVLVRNGNGTPKYSFAFADSFANPMDAGNKEYYLASAFSHVHLQSQGELNLYGAGASNMFLRGTLDKYGIKAHVFKHGKYKNAPNNLTEHGFTRDHKHNVTNIVDSINHLIYDRIVQARNLQATDGNVWKLVQSHGTFTAAQALALGFIDYAPQIDPLDDLVQSNKGDASKEKMMLKYGKSADLHHFAAKEKISLSSYKRLLKKRKTYDDRIWKVHALLKFLAEKSTATETLLSAIGYSGPHYNVDKDEYARNKSLGEKISLVHINGGIDESMARKTVAALKNIQRRSDVQAVVLRIDSPGGSVVASERILQQVRDMSQPVVCSMGNVAASGGYYVAADCERIFALPNTITGSIGVYGIKLDMTEFARRYGVRVEHLSGGPHTFTSSPFHPLTRPMKDNLSRSVNRYYDHFKSIVVHGRGLSPKQVEDIAQGRVWTGEQAKTIGLVDEVGGLDRALAYAKRKYTGGDATVEVWPKAMSIWDHALGLVDTLGHVDSDMEESQAAKQKALALVSALLGFGVDTSTSQASPPFLSGHPLGLYSASLMGLPISIPSSLSGVVLTADENLAVQSVLNGCLDSSHAGPWGSPGFWE